MCENRDGWLVAWGSRELFQAVVTPVRSCVKKIPVEHHTVQANEHDKSHLSAQGASVSAELGFST